MTGAETRAGLVALVGRPNVGKSTLLNRLVGEKVSITSAKPQTTRNRITGILTRDGAQYVFVDTPGLQARPGNRLNRGMNRTALTALAGVDVVVLVVEALQHRAEDDAVIAHLPADRPALLAVNKVDRVRERERLLPFIEKLARAHAFAAVVPLSAEHGTQVDALLAEIRTHLPAQPFLFPEDQFTDANERFLAAELVREKIFRLCGQEVPYFTGLSIERFEQEGELRRIYALVYVDRPGQKAILIGTHGERLKRIASEARADMEALFGGKVWLEVWVKVKPGWADNAGLLQSLGLGGES